jgi:hypothetical protein
VELDAGTEVDGGAGSSSCGGGAGNSLMGRLHTKLTPSPAVAGSELRQALLFESVSEYVSSVARVDESQRGRNGLSWFGPIDALHLAVDDLYTQEHPKLGGYNRV